jgi:hypothetical protein
MLKRKTFSWEIEFCNGEMNRNDTCSGTGGKSG